MQCVFDGHHRVLDFGFDGCHVTARKDPKDTKRARHGSDICIRIFLAFDPTVSPSLSLMLLCFCILLLPLTLLAFLADYTLLYYQHQQHYYIIMSTAMEMQHNPAEMNTVMGDEMVGEVRSLLVRIRIRLRGVIACGLMAAVAFWREDCLLFFIGCHSSNLLFSLSLLYIRSPTSTDIPS